MKTTIKNLCIIFLVALLGGFVGTLGASELNKANGNYNSTYNTQTVYTNKESSDVKSAIQKAYDTVVRIECSISEQDFFNQVTGTSSGSGVIISADGYIITNHHVIGGATDIKVYLTDNTEYEATIIGSDEKSDIAVLKIDAKNLDYAEFADSDAVEVGDDAIAIGNPLGSGISVTTGIISATHKQIVINNESMNLLQTNAQINSGNSGGGLFNISGQLIGIVNAKTSSSNNGVTVEGLGYAIPSNTAKNIADALINDGYVKDRPTLGVTVTEVGNNMQGFDAGLYITDITEDSAAQKAGLQAYDRIIEFNGVEISGYTDLSAELSKLSVGDVIEMVVIRNNQEVKINITLGEATNTGASAN